jgi:hypothetical protein
MKKIPSGMVAVIVGPDGREIAHAADFSPDRSSGISKEEAQSYRAKTRVMGALVERMCSGDFAKAIHSDGSYISEQIWSRMRDNLGYKMHVLPVGENPGT